MFFEGTEKKVEIIISDEYSSLLDKSMSFWESLVKKANAYILSQISNKYCKAFLLSESSLFVFKNCLIMITCGKTNLINAINFFITEISPQNIKSIIYERKNEMFPRNQPSTFKEDAELLKSKIKGKSYIFGREDEHYLLLYNSDIPYKSEPDDITLEILMFGIDENVSKQFDYADRNSGKKNYPLKEICNLMPNFEIDEYFFTPAGYSLNAIYEKEYFTVHVTPEILGSYVSFESNKRFNNSELSDITYKIIEFFKPNTFDIICFNSLFKPDTNNKTYGIKSQVLQELSSGYAVQYSSFIKSYTGPVAAKLLF